MPTILIRSDINYLVDGKLDSIETHFSGIERQGEYLMELTFNDTGQDFNYIWEYINEFLIPVHEVKVDGVTILRIWKNDLDHTYLDHKKSIAEYRGKTTLKQDKNTLNLTFESIVTLSSVQLTYNDSDCTPLKTGYVETSKNGIDWLREKDSISQYQARRNSNLEANMIRFYLAGREAQHVRFLVDNTDSCVFNMTKTSSNILE